MKRVIIPLLLLVLCSCVSELPSDDRLRVINNSDKIIYYDYEQDTILSKYPIPMDSVEMNLLDSTYSFHSKYVIKPHSARSLFLRGKWEDYIKDSREERITIFLLDGDVLSRYNWDVVRARKMYLVRYSFSLNELIRRNWTVNYQE